MASSSGNSGPWFSISMGLMGLIVGYSLASALSVPAAAPSQVAPLPTPSQPNNPPPPPPPPVGDVRAPDSTDHVRGPADALITVIEYSDFECPFCQRVHPTIQKIVDDYDGKVNWVFRHFPLGFHPNARPAAVASECVAELGGNDAFWSFSDKIFEKQGEWAYETYVADLGLDVATFKTCLDTDKHGKLVDAQLAEGSSAGVNGTPGNIVYNNKTGVSESVSGAQPFENFKAVIDRMLGS